MNRQPQRIDHLCEVLGMHGISDDYASLAERAVKQDSSYCDYLEHCLETEQKADRQRTPSVLLKMAGFPAIKHLEDYDYRFAVGAPKKQIDSLGSLSFTERKENVVLLGPSGVGNTWQAQDLWSS